MKKVKIIKRVAKKVNSLFYNFRWVLSKQRLFSVVMGFRGGGKTYGATKLVINNYIKKKSKSIWLRRQATEIDDFFLDNYFRDMEINEEFKDYEFKIQKTATDGIAYGQIKKKDAKKWENFLLFIPLSTALKHKSVVFSDFNLLIYDECFIDTMHSNLRYLNGWNEPLLFYEFFESIVRKRDNVRVIFIANALSSVNPYFSEWKVKIDNSVEWWVNDYIVIHNYKNESYKEEKLKTKWGQFIKNSKYGKYNIDNEFLNDTDTFIHGKTLNSKWLFNLVYAKSIYGVWIDNDLKKLFISNSIMDKGITYCFSGEDMKEKMIFIDTSKSTNNTPSKILKTAFKHGYLYFENQEIKNKMYELLGILTHK